MGLSQAAFKKAVIKAVGGNDELCAFPDEPLYDHDQVRRYNLDIATEPIAVTYPKTSEQVSSIVKLAAQNNLRVQAKGGGHSYANFCDPDGGVIVDLKHFQKFEVDEKTWRCRVGAGTLLGDLTKRMYEPHKRAMAHGTCPAVGIGGHATIGGLGPSSRLWGAALDHIEEVEVVVATGEVIRASANENSDIFWALRGAGASFGVITEFVVRTEAAPGKIVQYSYSFTTGAWKDMAKTFKAWQNFVSQPDLTRAFASTATITEAGLTISCTFYGTEDEFDKLAFGKDFPGNQVAQTVVFNDYLGAVGHWAETVALEIISGIPAHSYTKTLTFNHCNSIPDIAVDEMFKYFETANKGTLVWFAIFDLAGGAVNDVKQDATAYAHRDALFYLQSYSVNPLGAVTTVAKDFLKGLNKVLKDGMAKAGENTDLGAYAGYVDLELGAGAQKAYWRTNLPRLEQIKLKWDPADVFHNPQSVLPGGQAVTSQPKVVWKKESLLAKLKGCFGS